MPHPFGLNGVPGPSLPRIRGGHWYRTAFGTLSATTPIDDMCIFTPFWPAYRGTIDGVAFEVVAFGTNTGNDTMTIGIYDDDGQGRPTGSALFQSTAISLETSNGVRTQVVSWTGIKPKLYWLAAGRFTNSATSSPLPTVRCASVDGFKNFIMSDSGATPTMGAAIPYTNYQQAMVATTVPTVATLLVGTQLASPLILVKFT